MFDKIAPRYDFLNRLLSFRRDVYWRRALVENLELTSGGFVLDAACGTADVALEIVRSSHGRVKVVGIDFALEMLRLAAAKIKNKPIGLAAADVFDLPFHKGGFAAVTMAFGIRNIQNKAAILQQFRQQLKAGGRVAILELATPTRGPVRSAYLFYFNTLLPLIGRFFSRHSFAYRYLPDSVADFPTAPEFAALMRRSGFINVRYCELTLGIAVLFVGDKPNGTIR